MVTELTSVKEEEEVEEGGLRINKRQKRGHASVEEQSLRDVDLSFPEDEGSKLFELFKMTIEEGPQESFEYYERNGQAWSSTPEDAELSKSQYKRFEDVSLLQAQTRPPGPCHFQVAKICRRE